MIKKDARDRMLSALGGHGFGQAITIGTQLLIPAIYTRSLGLEEYGRLLIWQGFGFLFALFEFGIIQGYLNYGLVIDPKWNSTSRLVVQRNVTWVLVRRAGWLGLTALVLGAVVGVLTIFDIPRSNVQSTLQSALLGTITGLTTYLAAFGTLMAATLTLDGRDGFGAVVSNTIRLVDVFIATAAALVFRSAIAIIVAGLLSRCISSIIIVRTLCKGGIEPGRWLPDELVASGKRIGIANISTQVLPNAMPFILGSVLAAPSVALFTLARTLSRVPVQFASLVSSTVSPQLSRYAGGGLEKEYRWLFRRVVASTILFGTFYALFVSLNTELLIGVWLGKAHIEPPIVWVFLAAALFSACIVPALTAITATNQVSALTRYSIFSPIASAGALLFGASMYDVIGAGIAILCVDALCVSYLVPRADKGGNRASDNKNCGG